MINQIYLLDQTLKFQANLPHNAPYKTCSAMKEEEIKFQAANFVECNLLKKTYKREVEMRCRLRLKTDMD